MDILELVKSVSAAVEDAKAKEATAQAAGQKLIEVEAKAKAAYDAAVGKAKAEFEVADTAAKDAKVAGQRLGEQLRDALGIAFAPSDPRVRIG